MGVAASLFACAPAVAAPKTFVASDGADIGSCRKAAPCRTIPYAIGQTDADGVLTITDSEVYDPGGRITKPLIIQGLKGERPELTNRGGTSGAVQVDVGSGELVLRNLDVIQSSYILYLAVGIRRYSGDLELDNVRVARWHEGVVATGGQVTVKRSRFVRNQLGLRVDNLELGVDRSVFSKNGRFGLLAGDNTRGDVNDSRFAGNDVGFQAQNGGPRSTGLTLTDSRIVSNRIGLAAVYANNASVYIVVNDSTIAFNDISFAGPVFSYGDNQLQGNGNGDGGPYRIPTG